MTPLSRGIISSGKLDAGDPSFAIYNTFGFDGVDDRVDCGNTTGANGVNPTASFTVGAWVKADQTIADGIIFAKWNFTDSERSFLLRQNTGFWHLHASTDGTSNSQVTSTTAISTSAFQFIVGTYDGSNLKIYVDANLEDTTAFSGTLKTDTMNLSIGSYNTASPSGFYEGSLAAPILMGAAMDQTQITDMYNLGNPQRWDFPFNPSVVADTRMYIEMTSNDSTLNDLKNSNNGTGIGGVTSNGDTLTFEIP